LSVVDIHPTPIPCKMFPLDEIAVVGALRCKDFMLIIRLITFELTQCNDYSTSKSWTDRWPTYHSSTNHALHYVHHAIKTSDYLSTVIFSQIHQLDFEDVSPANCACSRILKIEIRYNANIYIFYLSVCIVSVMCNEIQ